MRWILAPLALIAGAAMAVLLLAFLPILLLVKPEPDAPRGTFARGKHARASVQPDFKR